MKYVEMVTNRGSLILELDDERAPKTVENFMRYVDSGFYDGTIFHRLFYGALQGGGFDTNLEPKKPSGKKIRNESDNGLVNEYGTLAMARTQHPHSARSQFFINRIRNVGYDFKEPQEWGYAVFGRITAGLEVFDEICQSKTIFFEPYRSAVLPDPRVIVESCRRLSDDEIAKRVDSKEGGS